MEDFDFEERYSVIKEIVNSEVIESNLKYFNLNLQPDKTFFGNPVTSTINSYKSQKYKAFINTGVTLE